MSLKRKTKPLSFCIVCHRLSFETNNMAMHCALRKHKYVSPAQTCDMGFPFHYEHYMTNVYGSYTNILNYDNNEFK